MDIPGHHWCGCEGMARAAPLPTLKPAAARPVDISAAASIRVIGMILFLFVQAPLGTASSVHYTAAESLPIPIDHRRGTPAPFSHNQLCHRCGPRVRPTWQASPSARKSNAWAGRRDSRRVGNAIACRRFRVRLHADVHALARYRPGTDAGRPLAETVEGIRGQLPRRDCGAGGRARSSLCIALPRPRYILCRSPRYRHHSCFVRAPCFFGCHLYVPRCVVPPKLSG